MKVLPSTLPDIEPKAIEWHGDNWEHTHRMSIAISLKRIADAMTSPVNSYGETLPEAIAGEIRRGMCR
jgi:hypothetical protein